MPSRKQSTVKRCCTTRWTMSWYGCLCHEAHIYVAQLFWVSCWRAAFPLLLTPQKRAKHLLEKRVWMPTASRQLSSSPVLQAKTWLSLPAGTPEQVSEHWVWEATLGWLLSFTVSAVNTYCFTSCPGLSRAVKLYEAWVNTAFARKVSWSLALCWKALYAANNHMQRKSQPTLSSTTGTRLRPIIWLQLLTSLEVKISFILTIALSHRAIPTFQQTLVRNLPPIALPAPLTPEEVKAPQPGTHLTHLKKKAQRNTGILPTD